MPQHWPAWAVSTVRFTNVKFMKNIQWPVWSLVVLALAAHVSGQSAASTTAYHYYAPPAGDFLVLSNVSGTVRVLDSKGLVLERNLAYLPRIPLTKLSTEQLQSLLETKTAYAGLTAFASANGTNGQGATLELQVQQSWRRGGSLAEKIQTRLEILEDLRDYNNEIVLLPGSLAAANQYVANNVAVNNRLTNRAAVAVAAAAQVETAELNRAAGGGEETRVAEQQAHAVYQASAARVERANDRANIANAQIAGANQQVTDHLARCAALAARLADRGIKVPGEPPFYLVPPLTLQTEVDAERKKN